MEMIHPSAIINADAQLGKNVSVGAYAVIDGDTVIGDDTSIGSHAYIADGARIGKNCRIFNGASISTIPQDLKFDNENTTLEIGDNTTVREFCTLNRGTNAHGKTTIGTRCLIMAYCHVAHDCIIGNNVIISNNLAMAGHVEVGDNVTIGGVVAIHQFCRIGDYAFIGATSYINMDVVPYALCAGNPANIKSINKIGLERRGYDVERQRKLKRAYRILFKDHPFITAAIEDLDKSFPDDNDVQVLSRFAKESSRGLIRM